MANFNKTNVDRTPTATPSLGTASVDVASFASIGALAFGATTVFYASMIPANSIITDVTLDTEAGASAATGTLDVGIIMGTTTTADYFIDGFDSNTGGRGRSVGATLTTTDDCYITLTPLVANTVVDKDVTVTVNYRYIGEV